MTNQDRKQLVDTLLPDNSTGEISAKDIRDVQYQFSDDIEVASDNAEAAIHRIDDLELQKNGNELDSANDIKVPKQTISNDPAVTGADNRLITIANAFAIEVSLKNYIEQNFIDKNGNTKMGAAFNPSDPLDVITKKYLDGLAFLSEADFIGDNPTFAFKAKNSAQMQVIDIGTNHSVATFEWLKQTNSLMISLMDDATGVLKAIFELRPDGKAYIGGKQLYITPDTVDLDLADHTKPTRAECITAFKKLPHFDWSKDTDFYIKAVSTPKLTLIKYRAAPTSTDEASAGQFFYEVLNNAV